MMIKNLLICLVSSFAFAQTQNIAGDFYSIEPGCNLHLKIDSQKRFILDVNKKKKASGIIKISKEDNSTYITFGDVSSMYSNDTIYIQNSGNDMNPYLHFKECNEKYIHLAKNDDLQIIDFDKEYDLLLKNNNYVFTYSIEDLQKFIIDNPITDSNVNKYNNFAYYLSRAKEGNSKAIYLFKKILEKYPNRVVAYLNLADSYWISGDKIKAKENYKKYVALMKSQNKDLKKIPKQVWERIK